MQGIYAISFRGEVVYVGQSVDIKARWRSHRHDLKHGRHGNERLQRIADKYGIDELDFSLVEEVDNRDELSAREAAWIREKSPACNFIMPDECDSWRHTDETKVAISSIMKDKWKDESYRSMMEERHRKAWESGIYKESFDIGRRKGNETIRAKMKDESYRRHLSESQKGKVVSEETRKRQSEKKKEQWADPEYRAKMLEARRKAAERRRMLSGQREGFREGA